MSFKAAAWGKRVSGIQIVRNSVGQEEKIEKLLAFGRPCDSVRWNLNPIYKMRGI
jgi:hypothetical protein